MVRRKNVDLPNCMICTRFWAHMVLKAPYEGDMGKIRLPIHFDLGFRRQNRLRSLGDISELLDRGSQIVTSKSLKLSTARHPKNF